MDRIDVLLREKFEDFGENDWYCGFYEDKPETLDYTEYLLGLHDYEIETAIWNGFSYDIEKDFPKVKAIVDSSDCYPLVKAFIREREEKYYHCAFLDQQIKSERLLLKTMPDPDASYLFESIQNDHAAIPLFWNCLPGDAKKIRYYEFSFLDRTRLFRFPAYFGIYIADIATPIGYVGLAEYSTNEQGRSIFNLEYYLLPEHRRHGYIKEACQAAIEALKQRKILKPQETEREDVFTTKPFDPILILAKCYFGNESSKHVLESLGFVYEGIAYETYFRYTGEPMLEHHYHLLIDTAAT